jgi:hypothetical protein
MNTLRGLVYNRPKLDSNNGRIRPLVNDYQIAVYRGTPLSRKRQGAIGEPSTS